MPQTKQPHATDLVEIIRALPAAVIARPPRQNGVGSWNTSIDCGPNSYVSDAVPQCVGATADEACDYAKAWLLDDIQCRGIMSKRQNQPHWDRYDLQYRLLAYWRGKAAQIQAAAVPA